ncbi:hypothetical protein [Lysobacter sp. CA196]|uniref:hypothetical protein n=1 Tax=Lysobacter sp. CA196 TaxID=3455606 RepID=UPI003F8D642E
MRWSSLAMCLVLTIFAADASAQRGRSSSRVEPGKAHVETVETQRQRQAFERAEVEYRLRQEATATDQELANGTLRAAREWVDGLSPGELQAYLSGLHGAGLSLQTAAARATGPTETAAAGKRYLAEMERRIDAHNAEWVSKLRSADAKQLVAFARKRQADASLDEMPPRIVDAWRESMHADRAALREQFPLLDGDGARSDRLLRLSDIEFAAPGKLSEHELGYRQQALNAYIRNSPVLSKLALDQWQFRSPQIESTWRALKALENPLPGGAPEVVYFLDRVVAHDAIAGLDAGWGTSKRGSRLLEHADVDRLLSEFKGKTLILVGHMENRQFVMDRGPGREPLALDLPGLLQRAVEQGVLLVPIGCSSANEGAYFGFTHPISASQVSTLLQAIPDRPMAVGELFAAFDGIGKIALDAGHSAEYLELTVGTVSELRGQGEAISVIRIPSGAAQTDEDFTDYFQQWEQESRPLLDKGVAGGLRTAVREAPWKFLLCGFALLAALNGWEWLRANLMPRKGLISRVEYIGQRTVVWAGGLATLVGLLCYAILLWRVLLMFVLVLVGAFMFFGLQALFQHYFGFDHEK